MFGQSRSWHSIRTAVALALVLQIQSVFADNTLSLKKSRDNMISVEFSSTDAIAGIQFSVNARGGVKLDSFEGADRISSAAMGIYQYLKDDQTLNVVMLAPVRSSLPAGQGTIGKISLSLNTSTATDTLRVFLTNVVICDVGARILNVGTTDLVWNLRDSQPSNIALDQNFPNPFNPSTTIAYKLERAEHVRLVVYDITGRVVNTLIDQYQVAGRYTACWNADDSKGSKVASGMYFARLQAGSQVATMKMILAK
jgi:hypothetical protein